ncbi:MAG: hypothetical protein ACRD2F_00925, partial [Terriglobales bacterium]
MRSGGFTVVAALGLLALAGPPACHASKPRRIRSLRVGVEPGCAVGGLVHQVRLYRGTLIAAYWCRSGGRQIALWLSTWDL